MASWPATRRHGTAVRRQCPRSGESSSTWRRRRAAMRADFNRVDALSKKVIEIVSHAKEIKATNPAGTNLSATLNPNYRWVKTSGIRSEEKWGNLPGGEVFTTPGEVNGTYVVDGVVGDYLCEKYPDLARQPLTIHMRNNRITEVFSDNKVLEEEFWSYTHTDENRSEEHTSELQTLRHLVCRLLL